MDHAGTPRRAQEAADGAGTAAPGGANGGAASLHRQGQAKHVPKGGGTCCPGQVGTECLCMVGRALGRHGSGLHRCRLCTYPEKESMGAHRELPAGRKQQTAQAQTRWGANGGRASGRQRMRTSPPVARAWLQVAPKLGYFFWRWPCDTGGPSPDGVPHPCCFPCKRQYIPNRAVPL